MAIKKIIPIKNPSELVPSVGDYSKKYVYVECADSIRRKRRLITVLPDTCINRFIVEHESVEGMVQALVNCKLWQSPKADEIILSSLKVIDYIEHEQIMVSFEEDFIGLFVFDNRIKTISLINISRPSICHQPFVANAFIANRIASGNIYSLDTFADFSLLKEINNTDEPVLVDKAETVNIFSRAMLHELSKNMHKPTHWSKVSESDLMNHLKRNVKKMDGVISSYDMRKCCADVANYCMMLHDNLK